ncbi:hypothetical protein NESM_000298800 [Novymonas esmeraldas]|uniref:CCDC81 HU domain-containing protein n=1 Tax=Novymonas esmeraldas TaxID=1808958 RepID=A0AAW0F7R1_9TRYP
MLSSRGAITTNVALVECAAGQNKADKNVFLLSELEKAWVAVAVVARRLLLSGSAVQIAPFGALWTRDYVLLRDRQQQPYATRKLCFGLNLNYANRYGMDAGKVPLERPGGEGYVRVGMADVVSVCGVPARTAAAALKEFFLYIGEGISRGRVFQLSLPGVATIAITKQKVVLCMNEELRVEMFEIDSRKWPGELQRQGYEALQAQAAMAAGSSASGSAVASRPSTSRISRVSWRAAPASVAASDGPEAKKPVFVSAAPSGRLFEDMARQAEQRRRAAHATAAADREVRLRQADLDRRIDRYCGYDEYHADPTDGDVYAVAAVTGDYYDDDDDVRCADAPPSLVNRDVDGVGYGARHGRARPPSASGESIYNIIPGAAPPPRQFSRRPPLPTASHGRGAIVDAEVEPDVEVIEIVEDGDDAAAAEPPRAPAGHRPLAHKNAELERVLRNEESFSRPISRRTYHESGTARDLIYSQPQEAPPPRRGEPTSLTAVARPLQSQPQQTLDAHVAGTDCSAAARSAQIQEDVPRFGRKRFDEDQLNSNRVGGLLQYREY